MDYKCKDYDSTDDKLLKLKQEKFGSKHKQKVKLLEDTKNAPKVTGVYYFQCKYLGVNIETHLAIIAIFYLKD